MSAKDPRPNSNPESRFWDALKGKMVQIWPDAATPDDSPYLGRLVWVDVFAIGVALDPFHPDLVTRVSKNIFMIAEYKPETVSAVSERDTNGVATP